MTDPARVYAAKYADPEAERDELRAIGDRMQSEASRLAAWATGLAGVRLPYEVEMAVAGVRSAVEDWTEQRSTNGAPRERGS